VNGYYEKRCQEARVSLNCYRTGLKSSVEGYDSIFDGIGSG